jgi:hypothetical protein
MSKPKKPNQSKHKQANRPAVQQRVNDLKVIRTDVAGIDVGAEELYVCAPGPEEGLTQVLVFGNTTPELIKMAEWLKQWKVNSVAMESTGVYWVPPCEVLASYGMEAIVVETREFSRVPGRKTDMLDCQWIQCLHSHGLLRGCFRPKEAIVELRSIVRGKAVLVAERADWMRRMQKCLDQMNVRVHRAVSQLDGVTGDEDRASDREWGTGSAAIGEIAGTGMPQKRGIHCRGTDRTLARGSPVRISTRLEDVRQHRRAAGGT